MSNKSTHLIQGLDKSSLTVVLQWILKAGKDKLADRAVSPICLVSLATGGQIDYLHLVT